jgi:hypothetical protein
MSCVRMLDIGWPVHWFSVKWSRRLLEFQVQSKHKDYDLENYGN